MAVLEKKIVELPLTSLGVQIFGQAEREVGLFTVRGSDFAGTGEYAPYPGIHQHSVGDVFAQADQVASHDLRDICELKYSTDYHGLDQFFKRFPNPLSYVLSMAHFLSWAQRSELCRRPIPLAGLILPGGYTESLSEATSLVTQGFTTLKVKIGSLPIEDEIKKLKAIAKIGGKKISLRVDANGKLNYSAAELLFKATRRLNIEYFEEPLKDVTAAQKLAQVYGARLAMDESFWPGDAVIGADYIIIKASRFASVYGAMNLFLAAQNNSVTPIFSHCFDSDLSTTCFLKMAQVLGAEKNAHGIMPLGVFKRGVLVSPLRASRGFLT